MAVQTPSTDRYRASSSAWVSSFSCSHLNVLIVCRGPIRKEAMDVFEELGAGCGILLSEKDSVSYPHTIAPELRSLTDQNRIHRIPDYAGANAEEKKVRIRQIIDIALKFGYTHIFSGYGFMAEDAEFVEEIEKAGVGFMGPASGVHKQAGAKDMAKKLARSLGPFCHSGHGQHLRSYAAAQSRR
jgi:biotin carboxylase